MGYEDIKSGITKVLQDTKEKTIKVTEEVISCENDHPIVYINVPFGKIMRCPYCNLAYERIR
jgi:uncharacterized Zn-finger protein